MHHKNAFENRDIIVFSHTAHLRVPTLFNTYLCRERERDLLRLDLDLDLEWECLRLLSFLPGKEINVISIFALKQEGEKSISVFWDDRLTAGLDRSRDEGLRLSDSLHGFLDFLVGSVCL